MTDISAMGSKELKQAAKREFSYTAAGLVVNPKYPYLGATPDGWVGCDCCGIGIVEIKCPYTY